MYHLFSILFHKFPPANLQFSVRVILFYLFIFSSLFSWMRGRRYGIMVQVSVLHLTGTQNVTKSRSLGRPCRSRPRSISAHRHIPPLNPLLGLRCGGGSSGAHSNVCVCARNWDVELSWFMPFWSFALDVRLVSDSWWCHVQERLGFVA